jgi:type II secretory ATPase GspE/PulE/Tfp pilus assembly ATPase PilB-like protein
MEKELKEFETFRLDSERIAQELAKALNLPYFNLQFYKVDTDALKYIPQNVAKQVKALPLRKEGNNLILGIIDPYSQEIKNLKESLEKQGLRVSLAIISSRSLEVGLEEYKFLPQKKVSYIKIFEISQEIFKEVQENIKKKEDLEAIAQNFIDKDPFLILDYLLAGAIKFEASDIHFEPEYNRILVRYRLDGILYDLFTFPKDIYPLIKNRIKVLAGLMINIDDKPQDGSFSIFFEDNKIDIRVSSVPAAEEETLVLRILFLSQIMKNLEEIGLRKEDFEIIDYYIHQPNGMILNTGPTGSGKTTTLYSILMRLKSPEIKIITVEDPIEYKISGITQTEVDEEKGFTFAKALRAFLRQDPDVILVGEIRDEETAEIAVQASLTGHLVLSTLHTNDSLGAIPRLLSLKVNPKLIPAALRLVIAQRLVRVICPYCKVEYLPDENLKNKIKEKLKNLPKEVDLSDVDLNNFTLAKGQGCEKCFNSGYKGRIGIFELLRVTKDLEELIYANPSETDILKAVANNFVSLQQDALIKALRKITTIEEVERVTGSI